LGIKPKMGGKFKKKIKFFWKPKKKKKKKVQW